MVILKVSNTLLRPQLKWKESKWTPLVSAFAESLRGIKSTTHSKYWKYIHGCGDTLCRIQFLFILVYCLRYKISFHRYRSYIKVDTKFIQNPPPPSDGGYMAKNVGHDGQYFHTKRHDIDFTLLHHVLL